MFKQGNLSLHINIPAAIKPATYPIVSWIMIVDCSNRKTESQSPYRAWSSQVLRGSKFLKNMRTIAESLTHYAEHFFSPRTIKKTKNNFSRYQYATAAYPSVSYPSSWTQITKPPQSPIAVVSTPLKIGPFQTRRELCAVSGRAHGTSLPCQQGRALGNRELQGW